LAAGVRLFQLREKNWSDRRLVDHARQMESLIHEHDGLLIVNDRPDIALLVNADGVHLGQDDLSVYEARRILGPNKLIGVSTHTLSQAEQAVRDGADYLGVGPTFATQTKSFEEYAGLDFLREMAQHISLPWYAIGGIQSETLPLALEAGARRVAVSSAICSAESPKEAAEELLRLLEPPLRTL
jgi:thiamine-phosphate pyrophosphorylase